MALQFGVSLPQGWTMDLASIKDPVEAYEAMTGVAQTADEVGFTSAWLVDHFHTIPNLRRKSHLKPGQPPPRWRAIQSASGSVSW